MLTGSEDTPIPLLPLGYGSASPGPEAALMPDPGPGEVSATAATPPPAFPEFKEPLFGQAPIPVTEASGQHFQDPAPTEPPKLYPPLPVSTDKRGRETLKLSRDRALPESRRERKRTDKRLTVQAAALGKSNSGPPENLICPRDRTVLQPVPREALGPLQPNQCAWRQAFGHWKNECPKAKKEEAPAVVGLADLEIN
ncbi:uncharacterized protein ACBT57_001870 isoform 2-T2 [Dama dama]